MGPMFPFFSNSVHIPISATRTDVTRRVSGWGGGRTIIELFQVHSGTGHAPAHLFSSSKLFVIPPAANNSMENKVNEKR